MRSRLLLALAGTLALAACASTPEPSDTTTAAVTERPNPFFTKSDLPFEMPPFDRIRDEDYLPAFEKGMAQQLAEVEKIADNPEPATFENTVVAMEKSGEILGRVAPVFFNLSGADTNPQLQKIRAEIAPKLAAHRDAIYLNGKLFARVSALYDARETLGLDAESQRLLERYHTDFVRAGARLTDEQTKTLRDINAELASLTAQFAENVLAEVNDSAVVVDDVEELDGLTQAQIATAAAAAKDRGLEGKYVITLQNTTGQPPLASLTNRTLRERIFNASVSRGIRGNAYDNRAIVLRVMQLRADRAVLLGYPNHAAYVLEDETAKTTDAVNGMRSSTPRPAASSSPPGTGPSTRRKSARRSSTSTTPSSSRTSRWRACSRTASSTPRTACTG
jgi:peptidyl-dipeptidase Dcp